MRLSPHACVNLLVALVLFGISGCGLSDYQKRMDEQRARVQEFDEANKLLDDPLDRPMMKIPEGKDFADRVGWPFEPFLRLPKGYGVREKDKIVYGPPNFPYVFARYSGGREGSHAIFIAAAGVVEPKGKDELFFYTAATFASYVKLSIEDYYDKTHKVSVVLTEKTKPERREFKAVTPYPDPAGSNKVVYVCYTLTDETDPHFLKEPSAFDVYLHERSSRQMCIIVHRPLAVVAPLHKSSIEACLGSLDLTSDGATKRAEFKKATKGS